MNFKILINQSMFWHAVEVGVCIFSVTPSSGMNKPFSHASLSKFSCKEKKQPKIALQENIKDSDANKAYLKEILRQISRVYLVDLMRRSYQTTADQS